MLLNNTNIIPSKCTILELGKEYKIACSKINPV